MQTNRNFVSALRAGKLDPAGDEVETLRRHLYWTALAITGQPEDAADAVAETLFKIWRHIRSLKDPDRFDSWCRQILVNECRKIWRRERLQVPLDPALMPQGEAADDAARIEGEAVLETMMERLNPGERAVVALRYMHDMALDDIGSLLDIPIGTVKSRLARAHARIREGLRPERGVSHGA